MIHWSFSFIFRQRKFDIKLIIESRKAHTSYMLRTRLQNLRFVVQTVAYMRDGRQRKASRGEQKGGREGGRIKAGQIGGGVELSPSAQHDPFQRHVGSNQRVKRNRGGRKGRRGRRREGFSLKYVDPRATLGLFSLHCAECSRRIPIRHAGRESVYIVWYKNIALFSSLSEPKRAASPVFFSLFSSAKSPRACDHHYAHPPSPLSRSLLRSLSRPPSQSPSFLASCSLPIPSLGYLLPRITYPLNESKRKRCLPPIAPSAN